ncbi:hypothetical protein O6U65_1143 [Saccharomyces cerevisiae synthetic construct]|uniref:Putative uncharacterized protein YJL156W-A n=1 Tax=Saccharomyces cerevisiae (strain ATCC 204508 / S288c) TaxID=559292 RepID=YJ156_YEAST|nr:RecName: Full=Putative uncharacterized protein YJL156W-A [Saccharomyces cerevisiae S288C]WNV73242.1 hypothetical protein O6U65_1143 [Saccharomyces cerevisiae synthetic construct]
MLKIASLKKKDMQTKESCILKRPGLSCPPNKTKEVNESKQIFFLTWKNKATMKVSFIVAPTVMQVQCLFFFIL